MNLNCLKSLKGVRKKTKRLGRGPGSGKGGTCGKGHKGQKSRSGYKFRAWFEGGQMPLQRRLPKFGFKNIFRKEFQVINVGELERLSVDNKVDVENLKKLRKIKKKLPVKILGRGEINKPLEVSANFFSKSAEEKIVKAGGKVVRL
ncbi:50S ribosomal protein L15 [candidate division KSB1 bacterium]|nr:MAG: 50S ribosomal protein L15 [candidate division KSB1 bacterium]